MIKVLVVDDSALMVRLLSEMIDRDAELRVVGSASQGYEAVHKVKNLRPDVITMDVNMPLMDGLEAVEQIMSTVPTPIVMISSLTREGAAATIKALDAGAIDFISKPSGYVSLDIGELEDEIIAKIKLAAKIRVVRTVPHLTPSSKPSLSKEPPAQPCSQQERDLTTVLQEACAPFRQDRSSYDHVVTIGCSTGGPQALNEILQRLPGDLPAPVLVVQHMPEKFTEKLAEFLNNRVALHVVEAKAGMRLRRGVVYIAPGAYHMKILNNQTIGLTQERDQVPGPCPSVDVLMRSVARVYGNRAIGVILTGMGNDGVIGLNAIKDAYGATIAQDEDTALVFGMPRMAIESGCVDAILPLTKVADEIMTLVQARK